MSAQLLVAGVGRATQCEAANDHRPTPLRFVWHHILPETCGGRSTLSNLVQVCDNCHVAIHELLYLLKLNDGDQQQAWGRHGGRGQRSYALQGWELAVQAGTAAKIPNEGGVLTASLGLMPVE